MIGSVRSISGMNGPEVTGCLMVGKIGRLLMTITVCNLKSLEILEVGDMAHTELNNYADLNRGGF